MQTIDVAKAIVYCRRAGGIYHRKYRAVEDCGYHVSPVGSRQSAELLLIGEIDEQIYDAVMAFRAMGELYGRRALGGAKVFLKGDVGSCGDGYLVQSQSRPDLKHFVYCDGLQWVCDCEDYEFGKMGAVHSAPAIEIGGVIGWLCQHVAAVAHYRIKEYE